MTAKSMSPPGGRTPRNPWSDDRPAEGRPGPGDQGFEAFISWIDSAIRRRRGGPNRTPPPFFIGVRSLVLITLALLGFWLLSGFYRVQADQQGVVLRFGRFHAKTDPGLNYHLPWPIESVLTPNVTRVNRVDVGMRGFADDRFGGGALRDVPAESLMLTGDENIVDVDFSVFWVIADAPAFLFNIQNPVGTIKSVAESTMREVVGRSDIQPVLTGQRQKNEEMVKALMKRILDDYGAGVEITQVKMQKIDPPSDVIDAFRDVQAARADQERARNEANAYANRVVPEAEGAAQRIRREAEAYRAGAIAEADGEASRFAMVYDEYRKAEYVTRRRIFLETMENVLRQADKVVVDPAVGKSVVPYLPLDRGGRVRTGSGGDAAKSGGGGPS